MKQDSQSTKNKLAWLFTACARRLGLKWVQVKIGKRTGWAVFLPLDEWLVDERTKEIIRL